MKAPISDHFQRREPSAIRKAQILFAERPDKNEVRVINLAIGNVSLPIHPAMRERLNALGGAASPFRDGVVKYSESVGTDEARRAFLNVIASAGCTTDGLACVVTDGGSLAMELMILGTCGPGSDRPLLLLDPAYTNYMDMARRVCVRTVSLRRDLLPSGAFSTPDTAALQQVIAKEKPRALVVIPADNPTGQFIPQTELVRIARLCVEHGLWLCSDEAYRQLNYNGDAASSIWRLTEADAPGITGQRVSIESASKVFNACGLRVGALCTDNAELHRKTVAEHTANLCSNVLGQYVFGALADLPHSELRDWFGRQRRYYSAMMAEVADGLRREVPGIIVTHPESALYAVIDVRNVAREGFDAAKFVAWCAQKGRTPIDGVDHTLLVAPLSGFYGRKTADDPSRTQMRMAFVEPPEAMRRVPRLFAALFARHG